jgi:hypothetical protein
MSAMSDRISLIMITTRGYFSKLTPLILSLVLASVPMIGAYASNLAVGGEFALKLGEGLPNSAFLSLRLPRSPAVLGLGATIPTNGSSASFALLADWWLAHGQIAGPLDYYLGPGFFASISSGFALGLRVPVGLEIYPIKPLELFVEAAPAVTLLSGSGLSLSSWGIQAGFGFRFWF